MRYLRPGRRRYCRTDHLEDFLVLYRNWRLTPAFGSWLQEEPGGRCRRKGLAQHLELRVLGGGVSSDGNLLSSSPAQRKAEHRY